MDAWQAHHLGPLNVQIRQCCGKADRLGQPMLRQAAAPILPYVGMQDIGPRRLGGGVMVARLAPLEKREVVVILFRQVGNQSSPS